MRALLVVLATAILAACAAPVPAGSSSKSKSKGHESSSKSDSTDDDDDSATSSDDDTSAPSGNAPPVANAPNPVKSLADLPGSKIFKPSKLPAPAIVMLHGSEGGSEGSIEDLGQEMAQNGFLVLTLCWFDCQGLPKVINRIPLDKVANAGRWLKATKESNGKIGLFGWSRGAEMALLVTSKTKTDPYTAVAVHAPSDTIVAGFDPNSQEGDLLETGPDGKQIPSPAWTWQGKPVFGEPDPSFNTPGPLIDVNAFTGPLYVSQGEQDEVWPVTRGKHVVSQRKSTLVTKSHFFPGEGHVLMRQSNITTQHNEIAAVLHASLD